MHTIVSNNIMIMNTPFYLEKVMESTYIMYNSFNKYTSKLIKRPILHHKTYL